MALSTNRTVAYNLRLARELRDLKQEDAARLSAPHLGARWSIASWSAAERSVTSKRPRRFTASEIAAFAKTFSLPVAWFFLPPPVDEEWVRDVVETTLGPGDGAELVRQRAIEIVGDALRDEWTTHASAIEASISAAAASKAFRSLNDVEKSRQALLRVAELLAELRDLAAQGHARDPIDPESLVGGRVQWDKDEEFPTPEIVRRRIVERVTNKLFGREPRP